MTPNNLNKDSGFKVPKDYFEQFEERFFTAEDNGLTPKKSAGFVAPDGYFDSLEDSILSKIEKDQKPVRPLWAQALPYAGAIAAVLVIALTVLDFGKTEIVTFEDINIATIEDYINEDLLHIDDEDLTSLYQDGKDYSMTLNLDNDAILEYLDDRIEDNTLLFD